MALHATRINDTEVRITRLRKKMENENLDKASFDSLLRKRWLAEHMLEKEKEEDQHAKVLLAKLKHSSQSCTIQADILGADEEANVVHQRRRIPKSDANLVLFLQKSPTLRPLRTNQCFSVPHPRVMRVLSQDMRRSRKRSLANLKLVQSVQERSRSVFLESCAVCPQPTSKDPDAIKVRLLPLAPHVRKFSLCSSTVPSLQASTEVDDRSDTGHTSHSDLLTSRPSVETLHSTGQGSRTVCTEISPIERSAADDHPYPKAPSRWPKLREETESFGEITIWQSHHPRTTSIRSRSRLQVLDDVFDAPMPSYAQTLLDNFVQRKIPSLQLAQPNSVQQPAKIAPIHHHMCLTPVQHVLEPVSEGQVLAPAVNELSRESTPRIHDAKSQKRRSIFSLQLPRWSTDSARSPLTSSASEIHAQLSHPNKLKRASGDRAKRGLPSTQLYDLSQLDAAPDDIPPEGISAIKPNMRVGSKVLQRSAGKLASGLERSSKRTSVLIPVAALKRVGSRLSVLGRK